MTPGRNTLLRYIADDRNTPAACLGAAIAFLRASSPDGRIIADAADAAIKETVMKIINERAKGETDAGTEL